jgi:hypothetical protein
MFAKNRLARLPLVFPLLLPVACAAPPKATFLHRIHRLDYNLEDEEIKSLRFFVSKDVLAKVEAAPESSLSPREAVIRLERNTPGEVLGVGPDWIRVSFEKGGTGATFVTPSTAGDTYTLATEVEGREGLQRVQDLPDKVLLNEGTRYKVVYGADAVLAVSRSALNSLLRKRKRLQGRPTEWD